MFFAYMASKYTEKHDLFTEINFPSMYFRQNLNYTASAVNIAADISDVGSPRDDPL